MSTQLVTGIAGIPSERVTIALPRLWQRDGSKPAIILCPGTDDDYRFAYDSTIAQPLIKTLTDAGYPVACITPVTLWGNATARQWITDVRTYMQSLVVGARSGKIGLVGLSQGSLNVLSWAGNNAALAGGVTAYLPVTDLGFVKTSGYGAALDAAYGGSYVEATHGANNNPITMANANRYAGVPIDLVYSSNDPLIPIGYPTAFKNAVGSNAVLRDGGTTGHSWGVTRAAPGIVTALIAQMDAIT